MVLVSKPMYRLMVFLLHLLHGCTGLVSICVFLVAGIERHMFLKYYETITIPHVDVAYVTLSAFIWGSMDILFAVTFYLVYAVAIRTASGEEYYERIEGKVLMEADAERPQRGGIQSQTKRSFLPKPFWMLRGWTMRNNSATTRRSTTKARACKSSEERMSDLPNSTPMYPAKGVEVGFTKTFTWTSTQPLDSFSPGIGAPSTELTEMSTRASDHWITPTTVPAATMTLVHNGVSSPAVKNIGCVDARNSKNVDGISFSGANQKGMFTSNRNPVDRLALEIPSTPTGHRDHGSPGYGQVRQWIHASEREGGDTVASPLSEMVKFPYKSAAIAGSVSAVDSDREGGMVAPSIALLRPAYVSETESNSTSVEPETTVSSSPAAAGNSGSLSCTDNAINPAMLEPTLRLQKTMYFFVGIFTCILTFIFGFTASLRSFMTLLGETMTPAEGWEFMFDHRLVTPYVNVLLCEIQLEGACSGGATLCNALHYVSANESFRHHCPHCPDHQTVIAGFVRTCSEVYSIPFNTYGVVYMILMTISGSFIIAGLALVAASEGGLNIRLNLSYEENNAAMRTEGRRGSRDLATVLRSGYLSPPPLKTMENPLRVPTSGSSCEESGGGRSAPYDIQQQKHHPSQW